MSGADQTPRHLVDPTDELLLAQALETCLRAERVLPGSSDAIVARVPASARTELVRLLEVARALEAAGARGVPSPEFREAARARLMHRIGGAPEERTQPVVLSSVPRPVRRGSGRRWLLRSVGGLLAAGLTVAATLTASASALPGEPLYTVKQAREEVAVHMAADDEARAMALLLRANARLDETTRLLEQGRTDDAAETAQRYDDSVDRATSTLVTALGPDPVDNPAAQQFAVELQAQQAQIQHVLPEAAEPAQTELREALAASQRGRALAAEPAPVKQALNATVQVPVAQARVEPEPTRVPTATAVPPMPTAAVAEPTATAEPEPEVARVEEDRSDNSKEDREAVAIEPVAVEPVAVEEEHSGPGPSSADVSASDSGNDNGSNGNGSRGGPGPQVARPQVVSRPPAVVAPAANAEVEDNQERGGGGDDVAADDTQGRQGGEAEVQAAPPVVNAVAPAAVVQTRGQDGGGDDGGNRGGGSPAPAVQASTSGNQGSGSSGSNTQGQGDRGGTAVITSGGGQANTDGGRGDGGNRAPVVPTAVPANTATPTRTGGDRTVTSGSNNNNQVRPAPTATPVRQQSNTSPTNTPQTQQNNNRQPSQSTTQSGSRSGGDGGGDGSKGGGGR